MESVAVSQKNCIATRLSNVAVNVLIEEAELTPKPGLVDKRGSGCHTDMTLQMLRDSSFSLRQMFYDMAEFSMNKTPSHVLRAGLASIGRNGENIMLKKTGGVNTHRGAIWTIGLLTSACVISSEQDMEKDDYNRVVQIAAQIALIDDSSASDMNTLKSKSNGEVVRKKYGIMGAKQEAQYAFPTVINIGLPTLWKYRAMGEKEQTSKINALLAIIANLNDTCIVWRSNLNVLKKAQQLANDVITAGGIGTTNGTKLFNIADDYFKQNNISAGGSADLLSATLFLDNIYNGDMKWKN